MMMTLSLLRWYVYVYTVFLTVETTGNADI